MLARLLRHVATRGHDVLHTLRHRLVAATKPAAPALVAGALTDLVRTKPELVAENALLRQQLVVLRRSVKRPRCTSADRALLVLLARRVQAWRQALLLVQPDTLLRWHRHLFRRYWRRKSRPGAAARQPKVSAEAIALIRAMAAANPLWGAERIRGELLKLDIRVAKWTVQKYMRAARPRQRAGQTWATFLRNHAGDIWACDFLPVTDLLFRPVYAFFVVALGSRRVVHVGVTRHPTDAWVAQQLREATPFGQQPRYLIRDNDRKYGPDFAHRCCPWTRLVIPARPIGAAVGPRRPYVGDQEGGQRPLLATDPCHSRHTRALLPVSRSNLPLRRTGARETRPYSSDAR